MNEDRIREIAKQASAHAEATVPPHWDIEDGLDYSAKMMKVRDLVNQLQMNYLPDDEVEVKVVVRLMEEEAEGKNVGN